VFVLGSLASAITTTDPLPKAVITPAVVPELGAPVPLVLIGKILGAEEIQVTEFVRSLTVGDAENVPIARYCPVSCRSPTVMELGIMERERSDVSLAPPAEVAPGTVMDAPDETTPPNPFILAVMVVVPAETAVARPEALTVATAGALELHVTVFVTSSNVGG
jgi:hypothetical protein